MRVLLANVNDDLITEARHLVFQPGALGQNFHVADLRQMRSKSVEESGVENQLLFVSYSLANELLQLFKRKRGVGFRQLDRRVKSFEERQATYVANKNKTSRTRRPDRTFEYVQEISDTWKVLHDRIENHGVERIWLDVSKVVSTSFEQNDFAVLPVERR